MRRLLAIGVLGSWEGGWQRAHGNEHAVIAAPIGEGEKVWLEVDMGSGVGPTQASHRTALSARPTHIEWKRGYRYRIVKDDSEAVEKTLTNVEMLLHGSPSS